MTMVVALLTSLVLALTLTPALAVRLIRVPKATDHTTNHELGGPILRRLIRVYEWAARRAIRRAWLTTLLTVAVLAGVVVVYDKLKQDFLPEMDEGAFVLDYQMPPGTALGETDRVRSRVAAGHCAARRSTGCAATPPWTTARIRIWPGEPLPDEYDLRIYSKNGHRPGLLEHLCEAFPRHVVLH